MARRPKEVGLGRQVAQGPCGPILELLQDGRPAGEVELAEGPEDEALLRERAARLEVLRHPFISRTHGLVEVQGRLGLKVDLGESVDLAELCLAGPVPVDAALDLFRKLARALHAAWDLQTRKQPPHRLVHGALDARDVWLDASGHLRLHGLGMVPPGEAGAPWPGRRGPGQASAPERLRGEPLEHAADVYALGAWLVRALSGADMPWASPEAAWHEATEVEARARLATTGIPELAELVGRTLRFRPADRPDAQEVERELERLRRGRERGALEAWAAVAVPSALALRRAPRVAQPEEPAADAAGGPTGELAEDGSAGSGLAAAAPAEPVEPGAEVGPPASPAEGESGETAGEGSGASEMPPVAGRRLWELRGPEQPRGPSKVLSWEPSPPETDQQDPRLLSERLDDLDTETSSPVIDLGTGQFVLVERGLRPHAQGDGLGVAVVPGPAASTGSAKSPPPQVPVPPVTAAPIEAGPPPTVPRAPGRPSPGTQATAPRPAARLADPGPGGVPRGPAAPARARPPVATEESAMSWAWLGLAAAVVLVGLLLWARRPAEPPSGRTAMANADEAATTAPPAAAPPDAEARPALPAAPEAASTEGREAASAAPADPLAAPAAEPRPAPPDEPPSSSSAEPRPTPPLPSPVAAPDPSTSSAGRGSTARPRPEPPAATSPGTAPAPATAAGSARPSSTTDGSTTGASASRSAPAATPPRVSPSAPLVPIPVREPPASVRPEAAATTGRLVVKGDASRVRLVGAAGSFDASGELPAGAYEVTAWFGESAVEVGRLVVVAGQSHSVDCRSAFLRCTAR